MGFSRWAVTKWLHRNCRHLRTHRFFPSFWWPTAPSTGKSPIDSCPSSSSSSSFGLIARNHTTSLANFHLWVRLNSWDPCVESSSCCAGTPCPLRYQKGSIFARKKWIFSSFCGADRKDFHFIGTLWWGCTYWRLCTSPYRGRCWDVWDR